MDQLRKAFRAYVDAKASGLCDDSTLLGYADDLADAADAMLRLGAA
jgi:hypothetical protein